MAGSAAIDTYASELVPAIAQQLATGADAETTHTEGTSEARAAFHLTLDAINFGSGWFPSLRKRPERSGYFTIAISIRERFARHGHWSARELAVIRPVELAAVTGQDPGHELIALYANSLNDLGAFVESEHRGSFVDLAHSGHASAVALAERLAGLAGFTDTSTYEELLLPFRKRAQIAAADLHAAGLAQAKDLHRLTMFADNLVPHVLRLDGVLTLDPRLSSRIAAGDLIEHGSPEEVELRACALHAVERIVAALAAHPATAGRAPCAAEVDRTLWNRGQQAAYKSVPRHRSRCTAY